MRRTQKKYWLFVREPGERQWVEAAQRLGVAKSELILDRLGTDGAWRFRRRADVEASTAK